MEQPGPSHSRRRLSKNTMTLPPADTDLGGHLHFRSQRHRDRYSTISQCVILPGSLITHIALNAQLLDHSNTNMHIACTPHPIDIATLDRMGLLTRRNGLLCFTAPGEPGARLDRCQREASPGTDEDPTPLALETVHDRFDSLNERLRLMELNLHAYFEFMQFQPPFPPPN
ncbi:UNVERIFIED_CONTAM: hypothetical protein Slati_4426900 [Sesamum latifolium]|uniref:Uncharacterized protein n=1 Tax=Sesamum latifolium TaxID=2727402 RepID=A0AAW2SQB6_9LAMI